MPVIKSAEKQLRQDKHRTVRNDRIRKSYKTAVKEAREKKTKKSVAHAYSVIDKAAKRNVIHANKAARLKNQVARHAQS